MGDRLVTTRAYARLRTLAKRVVSATAAVALIGGALTTWSSGAASANTGPLSIAMTASSNPVASGASLTYTITVTNTGGASVDTVNLTDQINGLTGLILTSNVGSCGQTSGLVTCNAGTLTGGQAWTVTIRGSVNAANGETLHNTATVSGTKSSNTFTASTTADTLVSNAPTQPMPDLTVNVSGPSQVAPGGSVTYNLTVNNIGTANATGISVTDTLPTDFNLVSVNSTSLFVCNGPPAIAVTCSGGAVNFGANATITITATAPASAGPYVDTAVVDPYDTIAELNELNNTGSLTTQSQAPPPQTNLTITNTDAFDPIAPGQLETYNIHVQNTSGTRADSVAVVDGTQGLDAASIKATTTKGVCTVAAPKVTCTQTNPTLRLNAGDTMDVTITGTVVATAGTLITNTATVTGNVKNTGIKSTATATTVVRPGVDLTVVQTALTNHTDGTNGPGFRASDDFNYKIVVGNSGINTASNVVVREPLPAGMVYKSLISPGSGVSCGADASQVVTCTITTLPGLTGSSPGGSTFEFVINVIAPPTTGPITATVTVDPNNAIHESDETNNTSTITTVITTGIDLTVQKAPNFLQVAPSGNLVYTITATNLGTQDTTGVVVRDTLPAGTRFRSVVPQDNHNFTCSSDGAPSGGTVNCVGGILLGTADHSRSPDFAVITLTLFAPPVPQAITNVVRIDPDGTIPEIDETNNINTVNSYAAIPTVLGSNGTYNELTIAKTQLSPAAGSAVAPSGLLDYELKVQNYGSDAAFGVEVKDSLPQGATFRYAQDESPGPSAFSCALVNGGVDCTGATLDNSADNQTPAVGDNVRTIKVGVFAPTQPGFYTNQAVVDPNNTIPEADETNNSSQLTTQVALGGGGSYIDLKVPSAQTSPAGSVVPSGQLEYTLSPENVGTAAAFNVTVSDTLPAGTVFRSAKDTGTDPGFFTCAQANGVVTCTGGTLDGSNNETTGPTQRSIVIDVFAPTQPGNYTNQANIDPANQIAENDETNNTSQVVTTVAKSGGGGYIDLHVKSLDDSTDTPSPGQQYSYSLVVENLGTDPAFNVEVKDVLPAGAHYVNATADGGFTCTPNSNVLDCTGGVIDGSSGLWDGITFHTITITVNAPGANDVQWSSTGTATLVDQAQIDPSNAIPEADETNNSASKTTTATSKIDLTATNDISGLTSNSEGDMSASVVATGADAATNVTVLINLPVGVVYQNVDANDSSSTDTHTWSCTPYGNPINTVVCTGDLDAGSTHAFKIHVFTTAQGETINSTTTADPPQAQLPAGVTVTPVVETNEANNTATSSASV